MKKGTLLVLIALCLVRSTHVEAQLPQASVRLKVVDEEGAPVVGASANAAFSDPTSRSMVNLVEGLTNNAGEFAATARTDGHVVCGATRGGYYRCKTIQDFGEISGGHWVPRSPKLELVLRRIVNPVPMYAKRLDILIPTDNKALGFDLVESDWVAPFGRGKITDFIFLVERKLIDLGNYDVKLILTFPNRGDGIQTINAPSKQGSELRLPREAPAENYSDKWVVAVGRNQNKSVYDKPEADRCFFFRVRTAMKDGAVEQAMYGKIQGDIRIVGYGAERPGIRFNYYLNPDGTRNMEFDPKRNLLKNLKGREEVRDP